MLTLPIGCWIELNAIEKKVSIIEDWQKVNQNFDWLAENNYLEEWKGLSIKYLVRSVIYGSYKKIIIQIYRLYRTLCAQSARNALTLFAVWIGTLQLLIGYVPDYPLTIVGYYSLFLILKNHFKKSPECYREDSGDI